MDGDRKLIVDFNVGKAGLVSYACLFNSGGIDV